MVRWATVLRNILSNWVSYFVTALVGFFLAPFVVHQLGNTGYGLWTLVLSLTGYFGLLDLGVRSSVGRFVARYVALQETENVNRIVNTAFAMLATGGAAALLITLVLLQTVFGHLHVEPQYESAAKIALLMAGLNMAAVLPMGVFSSVLVSLERFDVLSGVTIVSELCRAALVVACLKNGYGLIGLAAVGLFISAVQYCALAVFAKVFWRPLTFRWSLVNWGSFKELFQFGLFRFVWIVGNQLIFYSDSVIIGLFLGASAITPYAIAGSVINYGRNVVSLVADTLYPAASRMDACRDSAGLKRLLIVGTRMVLLVSLPLCIGFIFLGRQFIAIWMGGTYGSSAVFLIVLTIPQFFAMPQYVSALILGGMARHKTLAYIILAEGVANLILSVVLVQKIGLIGVAWGTVIPNVICTGLIVPVYALRTLNVGPREYLIDGWLRPVICSLPAAAVAYACSILVKNQTWAVFVAEVAAICGVSGVASFLLCLDSKQRVMTWQKLRSFVQREAVIREA